jgi:large repetitive protein
MKRWHLHRRWPSVLSGIVVTLGVAGLVLSAAFAQGFPVRQVDLNDGGVWVTNDGDGLFGRLNKPAGSLDAAFHPPGGAQPRYSLDVLQDGAAVAAWDRNGGKLYPVDVARGVTVAAQALLAPAERQAALAGGTLAVLDPRSGSVWAARVDTGRSLSGVTGLDESAEPVASVAPGGVKPSRGPGQADDPGPTDDVKAALTVGLDGVVYAVSAAGRTVTIRPAAGGFAEPIYGELGVALESVQATAVGGRLAVFDKVSGSVIVPGGATASIGAGGGQAVAQTAGPDADTVIVATESALLAVDLDSGRVSTLADAAAGAPAAPVRLDDCVHAAWAGESGGYLRSCAGNPAVAGNLKDGQALQQPVFRVNRGAIVLNDLSNGAVWDLAHQQRVDNWASVKPPPEPEPGDEEDDSTDPRPVSNKPPTAVDDQLGARPGRTTLLNVLDNDSSPAGLILSISEITASDVPTAKLAIAPDGQSVAITVEAPSRPVQFTYTVDDGSQADQASVTVLIRAESDNEPPKLRAQHKPTTWTVASGGRLQLPVLADWRDFDGDPITLASAKASAGKVTARPDGFLDYLAPVNGGQHQITYDVSDGRGTAQGSVDITVLPKTSTTAVSAVTRPDVARGEVGQPITIHPLDNDLPGSDPADPRAKLKLAGEVASPANAAAVTNIHSGVIVLTARKPGPYLLQYIVAFGNAPFAKGTIRVDVVAAPTSPSPPVAMPDTAVLRGQLPTTVDVLANDFDPAGGVLAVQRATPAGPGLPLELAIVDGQWLRIRALSAAVSPQPRVVRYTVSNGVAAVTGEVTVTMLADTGDTAPVANDDEAVVRAGDTVTVAVLDNDTNPAGAALALSANVPGAPRPGQLAVTSDAVGADDPERLGSAYTVGDLVRYVAPAAVPGPQKVTVDYVARNAAGDQAVGRLHIVVRPAPGAETPNRPPAPYPVEARVVSGREVTVSIPTGGIDADGDAVTLTGITSAPRLGRVISFNATSFTYQPFPTSVGTDTFTYQVRDRFGGVGEAGARIGVTGPGSPQPPVAVDDQVTAAPGAEVTYDLLANDVITPGDLVNVELVGERPDTVRLNDQTRLLTFTAPGGSGKPLVVRYLVGNGIGEPSQGTLTVRSQPGYNIPPVAPDLFGFTQAGSPTVTVEVLAKCVDPDGDTAGLRLVAVHAADAVVAGPSVTLPAAAEPRTVSYEIEDAAGARSVGLIHVSAPGTGMPYAKPDAVIRLDENSSKTIDIADYVVNPSGKPVRLTTTDRIWAAPAPGLSAVSSDETTLELATVGGYVGPAALTFEVTDGVSLTDPAGVHAVIAIPVQIGPETPVLRCPDEPLSVIEGGATLRVDVARVCHVWVADPGTLPGLRYTASWQQAAAGVDLAGSGSSTLEFTADSGTPPGATATVEIRVQGTDAAPATLALRVAPAQLPRVSPVVIDGVKAGDTATVDVTAYVRSQLREPRISVVSASQAAGMPAAVSSSGPTVTLTPDGESHGTMTFVVTVTDVADTARTDRYAALQITLNVLGSPDAPGQPIIDPNVRSQSVQLSWPTPANYGAPIQVYKVRHQDGGQDCPASPCLITGLVNGDTYTFTVAAVNLVGEGRESPQSQPAMPNAVPGAVPGLRVSDPQDGTLRLDWDLPPNEGTKVLRYDVTWSGGGAASSATTGLTATGLDNNSQYAFTVIAVNAHGPGPSATVDGQSAGAPPRPPAPAFASVNSADAGSRAVTVSWPAVDPNGPGPTRYTLTRSGNGTATICADVITTSCPDDGISNDGTVYSYTLTASNAAAAGGPNHTSSPSPASTMEATATPGPITNLSAAATGVDGQATITFDAPASHGASSTVSCTYFAGSCGTWALPVGGQQGVTRTINGLPNGQNVTLSLRDCNGSTGGAGAGSPCNSPATTQVTTYGPMRNLNIATSANGTTVNFTVSVDPNGKPATVRVQTSRQDRTFTTGVGAWSWSSSDDVGYSANDTITVTVSDAGRATLTGQQTQATPPPPPTVTVSKGAACGGGGGSRCNSNDPDAVCVSSSCAYIRVTTANFPGPVTCTFDSERGNVGWLQNRAWGANESKDSPNWYGYTGTWVRVTCNGVSGQMTWH